MNDPEPEPDPYLWLTDPDAYPGGLKHTDADPDPQLWPKQYGFMLISLKPFSIRKKNCWAFCSKSYHGSDPVKEYCLSHSTPLHPVQIKLQEDTVKHSRVSRFRISFPYFRLMSIYLFVSPTPGKNNQIGSLPSPSSFSLPFLLPPPFPPSSFPFLLPSPFSHPPPFPPFPSVSSFLLPYLLLPPLSSF
jgi:hypothetical protein